MKTWLLRVFQPTVFHPNEHDDTQAFDFRISPKRNTVTARKTSRPVRISRVVSCVKTPILGLYGQILARAFDPALQSPVYTRSIGTSIHLIHARQTN